MNLLFILDYYKLSLSELSNALPTVTIFYIALIFMVGYALSPFKRKRKFKLDWHLLVLLVMTVYFFSVSIYHFYNYKNIITLQFSLLLVLMCVSTLVFSTLEISINKTLLFLNKFLVVFLIISVVYSVLEGKPRLDAFGERSPTAAGISGAHLILISTYLSGKKLINSQLFYTSLLLGLFTVAYSFSRSVILALLIIFTVTFIKKIIAKKTPLNPNRLVAVVVMSILAIPIFYFIVNKANPYAIISMISKIALIDQEAGTNSDRMAHFYYFKFLMGNELSNWIFGLGFENYKTDSSEFMQGYRSEGKSIHSMYLQYILGTGLIGLFLLLTYIGALYSSLSKIQDKDFRFLLKSIVIIIIIVGLFQPTITPKYLYIFIPLLLSEYRFRLERRRRKV